MIPHPFRIRTGKTRMTGETTTLRPARLEDAPRLAQLINMAGHGLPLYLWQQMAGPGEDPWEIGARRRAERIGQDETYVIATGAGAVAGLIGYAQPPEPAPIPDDLPAMFVPMQELENLAPASWYVHVLAVLPEARGQGYGTRLLRHAEALARKAALTRMSIIVENGNTGARKLYERQGFSETASRPLVDGAWGTQSTAWVLLEKSLA